jgi:hypothetical protein
MPFAMTKFKKPHLLIRESRPTVKSLGGSAALRERNGQVHRFGIGVSRNRGAKNTEQRAGKIGREFLFNRE